MQITPRYSRRIMFMTLSAACVHAHALAGETLDVPGAYATLQDAIAAVSDGDVIRIAPGTHDVGSGEALPCVAFTIRGSDAPEDTILIGTGLNFAACGVTRRVENLTLREMSMYGAIEVRSCITEIDDLRVVDNSSHGFFVTDGGNLQATNTLFAGNLARGGYAYVSGFFTADQCEFIGNGYCECYGGGFAAHVGSGCDISNTLFKDNNANTGGAIGLSFSGTRTFTNCLFEGNTANDGPIWWTEFGACGTLSDSTLCGHSEADLSGCWSDGGGNEFFPDGCFTPCPGDVNRDRSVDGKDLSRVLAFWGSDSSDYPQADVNEDGRVDGEDLTIVLGFWGICPE